MTSASVDPLSSLAAAPRAVAELLAAAQDGLGLGALATCLDALGLRHRGGAHDARAVLLALEPLEASGLLLRRERHHLEPALAEAVTRSLIRAGRFESLAAVVAAVEPLKAGRPRAGTLRRELRRALVGGDAGVVAELLARWTTERDHLGPPPRLASWLDGPLEVGSLRGLPATLAGDLLADLSLLRAERMDGGEPLLPLALALQAAHPAVPGLRVALARQALMAGELGVAEAALVGLVGVEGLALGGLLALIRGDLAGSVRRYARALSLRRKREGKGAAHLEGPEGALQPLAYLLHPSPARRQQARRLLAAAPIEGPAQALFAGHGSLARLLEGAGSSGGLRVQECAHPVAVLVSSLVAWWLGEPLDSGRLERARARAEDCAARWLGAELEALFVGDAHRALPGCRSLFGLRQRGGAPAPAAPVAAVERESLDALLRRIEAQLGDGDPALPEASTTMPHDPRPLLRLIPSGAGLLVQLRVRPFGEQGPALVPGQGELRPVARIGSLGCTVLRDLEAERLAVAALERALPSLGCASPRGGDRWLEGAEEAHALLQEIDAAGVRVEWPEGQPLRLRAELGPDALFMSVRGRGDWFSAAGELRVDRARVLQLHQLLALLGRRPRRFVRLDDGQVIALNAALQRHLALLGRLLAEGPGDELRLHRLATGVLAPVLGELGGVALDESWTQQQQALDAPRPQPCPVPRGLRAELRPYQREGYDWLSRLAELGAGACLADEMGLGKTVQVLALLLQRAWLGPALVVAPTSVCGGWCQEAARFAPQLRVHRFGSGDRAGELAGMGPSDLVVCSYGLLQAERALLGGVRWSTAVLDEAQAIKNADTQRHQAACSLQAELRVITTGTPIENHSGELWALFRFLEPGLLGSWERFRARFAEPIEGGDEQALQQLRQLLLPFVLRRTKAAVLQDLPPRTELRLDVELFPEERALYTAMRERAEDWLDSLEDPQPLQILAQLTKLRMACCNAAMVLDHGLAPASAKLEAFAELVEQLRAGGHRALVFSQFVRHLALLRAWLDARGVAYRYLDGSTPAGQRDREVRAFQAGEGELFLISLRAGGFGLNLTAADYVIHMDPWWNPAVEDQASDRVHRIGQRRPVTVYRLVALGTIEEKILALHARKRELAEGVLEGSDAAGRLGVQELMDLIRGR
jgi:hypothetical protein